MKILQKLFNQPFSGFKEWTTSLQRRFFLQEEWQAGDNKENNFKHPYENMGNMRDREMERLVKVIEETRNNHARYH